MFTFIKVVDIFLKHYTIQLNLKKDKLLIIHYKIFTLEWKVQTDYLLNFY